MILMEDQKLGQRVFVGIKVTDEIAEAFAGIQGALAGLPAHLIHPQDMHLTLVPPWQTQDQGQVEKVLEEVLRDFQEFSVNFKCLSYGPTTEKPRLAWVEGAPSVELGALKKVLGVALGKHDGYLSFIPHVTIARFSEQDRRLFLRHSIGRELSIPPMPVVSVELFASPHESGAGYKVLRSFQLRSLISH